MAKTRQQKEVSIKQLTDVLKTAKSAVFASVDGLKISDTDELRKNCRAQKVNYIISKKTLLKRALKDAGIEIDDETLTGGVALIAGQEDEVAPAQIAAQFAKKREIMKFLGGILEGKAIDVNMVTALAALPSKQALLAQLVGTLNAPVSGFVNVLAGNLRGLVNVLNNIKDSSAKGGSA